MALPPVAFGFWLAFQYDHAERRVSWERRCAAYGVARLRTTAAAVLLLSVLVFLTALLFPALFR